ncbi:MAG: LemA family protein [Gemmatimonadota bacterium]|nr:MAG: LemA family protein [Gemmatimonadota bacterium]
MTLLAASTLAGCGYSRIRELDERALEARSDIEIHLLRRAELAPTLVETSQRYAQLESPLVEAVADSRVGLVAAVRSTDLSAMESASLSLSDALSQLLAATAGYADLQADPGFQRLLVQLEDTRQQVVRAGQRYNEAVRLYNEYIGGFPQMVTAKIIGAESRPPYGVPEASDSVSPADR